MTEAYEARSSFPHGNDCRVTFLRRADNKKALVDVWQIEVGDQSYIFRMMRMITSSGPWVFASFSSRQEQLWQFRDDKRVVEGFKGASFTVVDSGSTYVLFVAGGEIKHLVSFVDFLHCAGEVKDIEDDALWQRIAEQEGLQFRKQRSHSGDVKPQKIPEVDDEHQQFFADVLLPMGR